MTTFKFNISDAKSIEEAAEMVREQLRNRHLQVADSEEEAEKELRNLYEDGEKYIYSNEVSRDNYQLDGVTGGILIMDDGIAHEELWATVVVTEHYADSGSDDYIYTVDVYEC